MSQRIVVEIEMPASSAHFKLPAGVNRRLQELQDRQAQGDTLSDLERREVEGLIELADFFSLLRIRAQRIVKE